MSPVEVRQTESVYQRVDWLNNPPLIDEVTNINWIIAVFPGTKKNDRRPDPDINSWGQPVKALNDLLINRSNLKGSLVFSPY